MLHFRFRFTLALSLAATCLAADAPNYQWPSPQYDTLEALLYEGRRGDGSNLASIQHPCRNRPDSNASVGGEWLRFVSRLLHSSNFMIKYSPHTANGRLFTIWQLTMLVMGAEVSTVRSCMSLTCQRCVCSYSPTSRIDS